METGTTINNWIEKNYKELKKICFSISKGIDTEELCQFCIEQFLINKSIPNLPEAHRLFYFAKIVKNNFSSTSSRYHSLYRKKRTEEFVDIDIVEEPYVDDPIDLKWVQEQIERDMKYGDWYYSRLFQIYIECGASVTKTSKLTTIPTNSVSRDLARYRKRLLDLRQQTRNNLDMGYL